MPKIKSKKPKKRTPEETKKFKKETKACHHNRVGYPALQKLALGMFKRSKEDAWNIEKLSGILHSQNLTLKENKKGVATLIDKYEDIKDDLEKQIEELQKANTQLTLNAEELKARLFGRFEMRLKNLALRPDKKKDN